MSAMTVSGVEELLTDLRLFALFKEYMESKHASEVVTAYVWLHRLKRHSPKARRKNSKEFMITFIGPEAPRQLNLDSEITDKITGRSMTDEQIEDVLTSVTATLTENWTEFAISPLIARFRKGEYEPRITQTEAKRFKFIRRERRESDDMIIKHFKSQEVV
jgi:hypothetical protein